MTVDIVLDVFQTIKYFSYNEYWYPRTKCKGTQNINKGVLTVTFVDGKKLSMVVL